MYSEANIAKAERLLGYRPKVSLEEGLTRMVSERFRNQGSPKTGHVLDSNRLFDNKAFKFLVKISILMEEITGKKNDVRYGPERLGDLRYFVCDISRAERELGWRPKVLPREGVQKLVAWIDENIEVFCGC